MMLQYHEVHLNQNKTGLKKGHMFVTFAAKVLLKGNISLNIYESIKAITSVTHANIAKKLSEIAMNWFGTQEGTQEISPLGVSNVTKDL
jgi:hypothetical protein